LLLSLDIRLVLGPVSKEIRYSFQLRSAIRRDVTLLSKNKMEEKEKITSTSNIIIFRSWFLVGHILVFTGSTLCATRAFVVDKDGMSAGCPRHQVSIPIMMPGDPTERF